MQSLSALLDSLIALLPLPAASPELLILYKVIIAVAGFLVVWIIARWLLHFVERRLKKYEFVQVNSQVFKIIRRILLLAMLLVVGTYLLRMTHIPILEKILRAVIIVFLAIPIINFLSIAIRFMQNKIAHQTENEVDDVIFELLSRFAGFIIFATAVVIALDSLRKSKPPTILLSLSPTMKSCCAISLIIRRYLSAYGFASISASPMMPTCKKPKTLSSK
jgi:biotin transporter BioY